MKFPPNPQLCAAPAAVVDLVDELALLQSDARKATAPTICASSEICSRVIPARITKRRIHCTDEIHASAYQGTSNQALQTTATVRWPSRCTDEHLLYLAPWLSFVSSAGLNH
jgi:hypothetical protein